MTKLTRAYLERLAREEADISGADPSGVLAGEISPGYASIRHRVWYRAHLETGESGFSIARAWGCDPSSVYDGLNRLAHAWDALDARLEARYGPDRAHAILPVATPPPMLTAPPGEP